MCGFKEVGDDESNLRKGHGGVESGVPAELYEMLAWVGCTNITNLTLACRTDADMGAALGVVVVARGHDGRWGNFSLQSSRSVHFSLQLCELLWPYVWHPLRATAHLALPFPGTNIISPGRRTSGCWSRCRRI